MLRTTIGTALIAVAAASCYHNATTTVNSGAYPIVSPDDGAWVTRHFRNSAYAERTLSRAATGDTTERESVRARVDEVVGSTSDGPTILRVTAGHYAGGDYYDSIVVHRGDLRPVREHLAYPQLKTDKRFEYGGRTVREMNMSGDSTATVERRYDAPVFAFSEIEMLVRSLPYRPGYTAILPLYSEGDDAIEMDSVAVVDARPNRWTVRFADPAIIAVYGVDAGTRRIVSYEVTSRKTRGKTRTIFQAIP
jgi:hypothetical protein